MSMPAATGPPSRQSQLVFSKDEKSSGRYGGNNEKICYRGRCHRLFHHAGIGAESRVAGGESERAERNTQQRAKRSDGGDGPRQGDRARSGPVDPQRADAPLPFKLAGLM